MDDSFSHYSVRPLRSFAKLFFLVPCLALILCSFTPVGKHPARSMSVEVMQMREYITGYAQNFIGLKYRYAGSSPKTGFDCSGFTSYILKEFDIKVSSSSSNQSGQGIRIKFDDVLPGDLVFFGRGRHIQHVAMVVEKTDEGIFCVHSTNTRGIVVENISTSKYWRPKMLFARDVISAQVIE